MKKLLLALTISTLGVASTATAQTTPPPTAIPTVLGGTGIGLGAGLGLAAVVVVLAIASGGDGGSTTTTPTTP